MKTYSEMILLPSFEERFEYLKLDSVVGWETFGAEGISIKLFTHLLNGREQDEMLLQEMKGVTLLILTDQSEQKIYIHHIEPITREDVINRSPKLFDLDNLVCVSFNTHNAIHYGTANLLIPTKPVERKPNDQCPWRKEG